MKWDDVEMINLEDRVNQLMNEISSILNTYDTILSHVESCIKDDLILDKLDRLYVMYQKMICNFNDIRLAFNRESGRLGQVIKELDHLHLEG